MSTQTFEVTKVRRTPSWVGSSRDRVQDYQIHRKYASLLVFATATIANLPNPASHRACLSVVTILNASRTTSASIPTTAKRERLRTQFYAVTYHAAEVQTVTVGSHTQAYQQVTPSMEKGNYAVEIL